MALRIPIRVLPLCRPHTYSTVGLVHGVDYDVEIDGVEGLAGNEAIGGELAEGVGVVGERDRDGKYWSEEWIVGSDLLV